MSELVVALDKQVATAVEGEGHPLAGCDGGVGVAVHATGNGAEDERDVAEVVGLQQKIHLLDHCIILDALHIKFIGSVQTQRVVTFRLCPQLIEEGLRQEDQRVAVIGRGNAGGPAVRVIVDGIDGAVRGQHRADVGRENAGLVLVGGDDAVGGALNLGNESL